MSNAIEVEDVTRTYGRDGLATEVLAGVSLTVRTGELVAIMGPSGSGKSTLLHLMGALDQPTTGTVRIAGHDLSGLSLDELADVRAREVGFVFQAYNLHPALTVLENVMLPAMLAREWSVELQDRARALLADVGLAELADRFPAQLSGGQQQRTAVVRALVLRPVVVLADEPTGNLDTQSGQEVLDLLQRHHASGQATVIVTHDAKIASRAERVLYLRDGRIADEVVPTRRRHGAGRDGTDRTARLAGLIEVGDPTSG